MATKAKNIVNGNLKYRLESRLNRDCNSLLAQDKRITNQADRESIVSWLLAEYFNKLEGQTSDILIYSEEELCQIYSKTLSYRYDILQKRYLGVGTQKGYHNLIDRLSYIMVVCQKLPIPRESDREFRSVLELLQEVIQEMLEKDRYIQKQNRFIARCTRNYNLVNSLFLATLEEYCLRPIRERPLLFYRVINFLDKRKRGGITHIPKNKRLRSIGSQKNGDSAFNILDNQAILEYKQNKKWHEQQQLRSQVIQEFEQYLTKKLGSTAAKWFKLYLQGYPQETTAKILNLPIGKVYRLREKITYHALKVFAIKEKPELIAEWLEISLQEHNLGLTARQWHKYWQNLTPIQQDLINYLKQGNTLKGICQNYNLKITQVTLEWSKIYLAAQQLRNS